MPLEIVAHKTLYRHDRFFSAFPSLARLADGTTVLAFRRAPDHRWMLGEPVEEDFNSVDHLHFRSHIALMPLAPDLAAAGPVRILPVHAEAADQDANLFVTRTGRLIQYGFLWYPVTAEVTAKLGEIGEPLRGNTHIGTGFQFWGGYTRYSDDGGVSWTDHAVLPIDDKFPTPRFGAMPCGPAVRGTMIQLDDGTLVFAAYGWGQQGFKQEAVRIYRSCDDGAHWQLDDQVIGLDGINLVEPALARWPEGQVTIFCRTGNNDDFLVTSDGSGDGRAFTLPQSCRVKGHPHHPLVLPGGRLFLCYGYRHDPMGIRARLVEPGQSLERAKEFVIRDDSPSKDTGYPSAIPLGDGRILVAYYIADERGIRGIEGTLLEHT